MNGFPSFVIIQMNVTFDEYKKNCPILNTTVTVIIPVLNAAASLRKVLQALSGQSYPQELVEIIVVDNGSTDQTIQVAKQFGANVLFEPKKSPYMARNRGVEASRGEIIALLDAGTIPADNWLEEGVRCIDEDGADMAGGDIRFNVHSGYSAGEVFDAITFVNNRHLIENDGGSAGGNLFFRREVWDTVGPFPEFRSSMDIWWTRKATRYGYKLVFADKAVTFYKARRWPGVMRKSFRIGKMYPIMMRHEGKSLFYITWHTIRCFFPPHPAKIRQKLLGLNHALHAKKYVGVWLTGWMCKVTMGLGRIRGFVYLEKKIEPPSD